MISTPCSRGLVINGVENVLSATRRALLEWTISEVFANHINSLKD